MFNGSLPEGISGDSLQWHLEEESALFPKFVKDWEIFGCCGGKDSVHPVRLIVSLEDLYCGTTKKVSLSRNVICSNCTGKGVLKSGACSGCQGSGQPCDECRGTGETLSDKDRCCPGCKGEKVFQEKKIVEVHVEKGMKSGQTITFSQDIVFMVIQRDHRKFRRIDDDLFVKHSLSSTEARCGFQFALTHLDGRKLLIKTNPGDIIKLGSFKARPFMKGKLYIRFTMEFSASLTGEQCKTLEGVLPVSTSDMEFDKCEEVTLLDVSMEEEWRKAQAQCGEDNDRHGKIQCAQQ
ncbi:hypothetical protein MKW94_011551 [Papaver nudicaule]|uniref:Chaperone DnaJ C-terminal domain-containing protein n=1 Tax=Papaver nudicaule TaxID=74823 RepID=A0AA41SGC2_PAPNU|nr:hypothetical protein [Papaver nudicaule]